MQQTHNKIQIHRSARLYNPGFSNLLSYYCPPFYLPQPKWPSGYSSLMSILFCLRAGFLDLCRSLLKCQRLLSLFCPPPHLFYHSPYCPTLFFFIAWDVIVYIYLFITCLPVGKKDGFCLCIY